MQRSRASFEDHSANSVQSLLALLRTSQDGAAGAGTGASPSAAAAPPALPPAPAATPAVPSSQQLSSLLASLDSTLPRAAPPSRVHAASTARAPGPASSSSDAGPSAFAGPRHAVFEAFGPVGQTPAPVPSRSPTTHSPHAPGAQSATARDAGSPSRPPRATAGSPRAAQQDPDELPFAAALPVLARLLEDGAFVGELRSMKAAQDALERRLWARLEKVKAEHAAGAQRDKDLAKLIRQPHGSAKEALTGQQQRAALSAALLDARRAALVALDGLAVRHRARLRELGVPGLGKDDGGGAREVDGKARERARRVMDVLGGALEE